MMLERYLLYCCQDGNTGHDGSISTGHANSVREMLLRLESMVLMGAELPIRAIRQQISAAVDIVVHLGRLRDRSRRVLEISEVVGMEEDEIRLNTLYSFEEVLCEDSETYGKDSRDERRKVRGKLRRINDLMNVHKLEASGLISIYREGLG